MSDKKILIYGYGNIGRQDDGLGVCFSEAMEKWAEENKINNISFESDYQLNIEDALLLSDMDIVVFADSSKSGTDFNVKRLTGAESKASFSTHKMDPETLVCLCQKLYNKSPKTYLVTIKGYEWGVGLKISAMARKNLDNALTFIQKKYLQNCIVDL